MCRFLHAQLLTDSQNGHCTNKVTLYVTLYFYVVYVIFMVLNRPEKIPCLQVFLLVE